MNLPKGAKLFPVQSFYGSKYARAGKYPKPRYGTIIEPFAGAAGYSLNYSDYNIHLYDKDERMCMIWDYLIHASASDIIALPLIQPGENVRDLACSDAAREVIRGLVQTSATGRNTLSTNSLRALARNPNTPAWWGIACRERLARTVQGIKHWTITNSSYADIPQQEATWFIDPPYNNAAGSIYRHNGKDIDYAALSAWCRALSGQAIVCENAGADWLPFTDLYATTLTPVKGSLKRSVEAVWTNAAS